MIKMKFFKKKEKPQIHAECETYSVRKYAPIRPAREFMPPGFNDINRFIRKEKHLIDSDKTVRACPGITDFMGLGYVIPAWCDIEIVPIHDGQFTEVRYSDPRYNHAQHPPAQVQGFMSEKFKVGSAVKLDNPWKIWTSADYSLMYLPMFYWTKRNWEAIPGVMDTDLGTLIAPINIMLKEPEYTMIKQGEPLCQIIPIKREKVIAETGDLSETAKKRHLDLSSLHDMSFKGWIKHVKDKKLYKLISKDTDLPE
jgi:hypothetical protein